MNHPDGGRGAPHPAADREPVERPVQAHVRRLVSSMALAEPLKFSAGFCVRAGVWGSSERSNSLRKGPAIKIPG
jgi:hypothetical protein